MRYGYSRVSSYGQSKDGNSLDVQEKLLREAGATEIVSETFTGTKADRPKFQELLGKLKKGDTLIVTKLDRFSRSASNGMDIINELLERGVAVHVLNMGLMDNTPTGKLIRNVMLAFAEFERDCIVERCNEGKTEAKLKNPEYKEGRKPLEEEKIEQVKSYIDNGYSISKACNLVGIGRTTYYKYC